MSSSPPSLAPEEASTEVTDVETGVPSEGNDDKTESLVTVMEDSLAGDTPEAKLESFLQSNPVAVLSKSSCPFCRDVIEFLTNDIGVRICVYHVDLHGPEGSSILKAAKRTYGHSTVPLVFVKSEFLGGCNEVKALHAKHELEPKLCGLIVVNKTADTTTLETAKLTLPSRGEARNPLFWFPVSIE